MRYFLSLSYKGTHYHGWQIQPNALTVQEVINNAISRITREEVNVTGCGRTDTGVHASYFVLHFDLLHAIEDQSKFLYHLNAVLPDDIAAFEIVPVAKASHARFDATARQYHYFLAKTHQPFLKPFTHRLVKIPDAAKLNDAAKIVTAQTDFASFCKAHADNKTTTCHIYESIWIETDELLVYKIKADRFLRNMVRALVGTMLNVGLDKTNMAEFQQIFEAGTRAKAGTSINPSGLFLTGVWYDKNYFKRNTKLPF